MTSSLYFSDLKSFIAMGGHGPFVWTCYAITFAVLAYLVIQPRVQRKRFIKQQTIIAKRKAQAKFDAQAQGAS